MARRGDTHRLMRWLWTSRRLDARLVRLSLLPASGLWRAATSARDAAYTRGWLPAQALAIPSVGVGNLTVGDSGKTPVALWIARHYAAQGIRPALVLRAGTPQRAAAHAHAVPTAIVVSGADRRASVAAAAREGAGIAILENILQPRAVHPDYAVAVVGAETSRAVRWPLPAGPWREGWGALSHADAVVVTRKRATAAAAGALADELQRHTTGVVAVAHLGLRHLEGLVSRAERPASLLAGRRVVAASGMVDPDAFVSHIKGTGAAVQVATWQAEGEMRDEDVAWLAHAARRADFVVVTEHDAVKLRDRWPARVAEPLVAILDLTWERNGDAFVAGLDGVLAPVAQS